MRKLTAEELEFLVKRAQRLHHRKVQWTRWRREKRIAQVAPNNSSAIPRKYTRDGVTRTVRSAARPDPLPSVLCFDEDFDGTLGALRRIRESLLGPLLDPATKGIGAFRRYPDFTTMDRISPSAALALAAEFDRARQLRGVRLSAVDYGDWQPDVRRVLDGLDFFSLLGVSRRPAAIKQDGSLVTVPLVSDSMARSTSAGELTALLGVMASSICDERSALYARLQSVIIEGMENTCLHAYDPRYPNPVPHVHRWWMTGAIDFEQKRLTVALLDQGATIPITLPYWSRFDKVKQFFTETLGLAYDPIETNNDHVAIAAAMALGATATGQPQHGKGLPEFRAFIDDCQDAKVRIVSRHGEYTYVKGNEPSVRWHTDPLGGTLVEWDVFL